MRFNLCCIFFLWSAFSGYADVRPASFSFFQYSTEEVMPLQNLQSEHLLTNAELQKWDAIARKAVEEKKLSFYEYTRIFTYLYVAQSDAASLSYRIKGELRGSLDPISNQVLSLFLPDYLLPALLLEDPYSEALAQVVIAKIKKRINEENALPHILAAPQEKQKDFFAGVETAKWIPWYAKPSLAYWPPPPPKPDDPIWAQQIIEIKSAQIPMTEEKKQIIYRWAGLAYPWSSDSRSILNQYLLCHNVHVSRAIQIRSLTMIGLYDCLIAYVGCKYHYLVIRPQAYDPSIVYEIPVPKHPSYPSGHSAESAVTATILSFFFPADKAYWHQMALQCGLSRIWAGIHYLLDDQGGRMCGEKVGEKVLQTVTSSPDFLWHSGN